jgi:hypothetical protein
VCSYSLCPSPALHCAAGWQTSASTQRWTSGLLPSCRRVDPTLPCLVLELNDEAAEGRPVRDALAALVPGAAAGRRRGRRREALHHAALVAAAAAAGAQA